jgi:catechol 2,3-dioxygenase-like lactoylglutathione lyase family enzyme
MKIKFNRIDHVQICIPKGAEDEARKFYSGLLGLEEIEKPDSLKSSGGVWYIAGNVELHLGVESLTLSRVLGTPLSKGEGDLSKRHPAFEITNIDEVKKFLNDCGVKIKEEIQIPGRKRFSFYDPFGNRIEFLEFN